MNVLRTTLVLFVAVLVAAFGVAHADSGALLGGEGEIQRLHSGAYGDLFPGGTEADADALVLALDVEAGGVLQRFLVPGSETMTREESPTIYHDPTVGVSYVLWSSRQNGVHPYLRLVPFTSDGWGDVLDIIGSVFSAKYEPTISVQHDATVGADGETVERTILSVLWWEAGSLGAEERMKTLVLEDGHLVADGAIRSLGGLAGEKGSVGSMPLEVEPPAHVVEARNGFLVGFLDSGSGWIRVLSVDILPAALDRLVDAAKEAARTYDPSTGLTLGQTVRNALAEAGTEFHPAVLDAMTAEVVALFDGAFPARAEVPDHVMDKIGPHVVIIGARMKAGGMMGREVEILEIPAYDEDSAGAHFLAVSEVNRWELPITGTTPELFVSERGTAAIMAWDDEESVVYRETLKDAWGPEQSISVTETLDRATIYRILEERALER